MVNDMGKGKGKKYNSTV